MFSNRIKDRFLQENRMSEKRLDYVYRKNKWYSEQITKGRWQTLTRFYDDV